jgi:hypothetical protein
VYLITHNDTNTHTHTHTQSVGLLWTGDRPVTKTSDKTQHSQVADINFPGGIRTRNPNNQALDRAAPGLGIFMCNLPSIISRLSRGSPLFALPMKMKLNTPRNIRINNSQLCRMPCRISLFCLERAPPHISLCKLGHLYTNWLACELLSGSRKVFRIMSSVVFLIFTQFWILRGSRKYWTRIYTAVLISSKQASVSYTKMNYFQYGSMQLNFITENFSPEGLSSLCRNVVKFPSYKPLTSLYKPPPYWAVIIMPVSLQMVIKTRNMTRINHTGIFYLKELLVLSSGVTRGWFGGFTPPPKFRSFEKLSRFPNSVENAS